MFKVNLPRLGCSNYVCIITAPLQISPSLPLSQKLALHQEADPHEIQNYPQQMLTSHNLIRHFYGAFFVTQRRFQWVITSLVAYHMTYSHVTGITNVIQLTFQMWGPTLSYR